MYYIYMSSDDTLSRTMMPMRQRGVGAGENGQSPGSWLNRKVEDSTTRRRLGPLIAAIVLGAMGTGTSRAAATSTRWTIDILPPLVTPVGELPNIVGLDLNELGQVAGTANDPAHVAAFRFTPGVGMEDLDPNGGYLSGVRIGGSLNDRGDVLLFTLDSNGEQSDIFLYTTDRGFRSLATGKNRRVRTSFRTSAGATALPNAGHICGFVSRLGGGVEPYIFRPESGWESLRSVHPRFRTGNAICKYTNERGDLVFAVSEGGEQEAFVSIRGKEVVELPGFARNINVTGEINDSGVVPGLYVDERGRERAYVWLPRRGLVDLQRQRRLRQAAALHASADSVVWGVLTKHLRADTIFSWTEAEGLRFRVRRPRLRQVTRRHGLEFGGVGINSASDRGAIVGEIATVQGAFLPYYFSRETGLVDLIRVIESLGAGFTPTAARETNDRGQVLLFGLEGDSSRAVTAVLSLVAQ